MNKIRVYECKLNDKYGYRKKWDVLILCYDNEVKRFLTELTTTVSLLFIEKYLFLNIITKSYTPDQGQARSRAAETRSCY